MAQTLPSPFVGTWKLVSCEAVGRNGGVVPLYGPSPVGRLFYDASGNMSVHIMRRDRAPLEPKRKAPGDPELFRAAFEGYQAYFSTYEVDTKQHVIHHKVLGSLYPNWIGTTQSRSYTFEGSNRLVLRSAPDGDGRPSKTVVTLVWERLES